MQEYVERRELKVGTQQRLVMTSMRAYQEEAVSAKDKDVVFTNVIRCVSITDDLHELILVFALVHVLFRG